MVLKTPSSFFLWKYYKKNIATARSECTTKHENKASCNTDYLVPDLNILIWVLDENTDLKKNWLKLGLFLVFPTNFLSAIWKIKVLVICISYWKPKLNSLLSKFSVAKQLNKTSFPYRSYFSIFVLRWDVSKSIKNHFIKTKKQLTNAN